MQTIEYALVAQLDRAFGYEPKGREFESLRAYLERGQKNFYPLSIWKGLNNKTVTNWLKIPHCNCFKLVYFKY